MNTTTEPITSAPADGCPRQPVAVGIGTSTGRALPGGGRFRRPACIADCLPDVGLYAASLSDYNAGTLHGCWIDLEVATTAEEIGEAITWLLAQSREPFAEEWAMHDHAGLPRCLSRSEWPDLEELATYAETVAELSRFEWEAFRLYCDDRGQVADMEEFRDAYCGGAETPEDYAEQLAEEIGAIDRSARWPLSHIDWSAAWRDLSCDGYSAHQASDGGVLIFRAV